MKTATLGASLVLALGGSSLDAARAQVVAIEHVSVIPMDRERVLEDQTVIVRDGRFATIARDAAVPAGATRVDGRGKWLIPGLADMHSHFLSDDHIAQEFIEDELDMILCNGVTTLRDPIGVPLHLALRKKINAGELVAPQLWVGSPQVAARKYPGVFHGREIKTPDEGRQAVRDFAAEGYDFIKLTIELTPEMYDAIVDEAARQKIRLFGHIGAYVPLARAIEARQQLEHLDGWMEALVPDDAPSKDSVSDFHVYRPSSWESLDWLDDQKIAPLAKRCAEAGMWNTPTMAFFVTAFGTGRSDAELGQMPEWGFVSEAVRKDLLRGRDHYWKNPPSDARRARYVELRRKIVKSLHEAGAKLMSGSDAPECMLIGGFALHHELEQFVAAGLTTYATLETSTRNPHEWLGDLAEVGTIEVGKRADFVLLRANPLEKIGNTRAIEGVATRGKYLGRDELDRRFARAKERISSAAPLEEK